MQSVRPLSTNPSVTLAPGMMLQRKCACGQHTGGADCEQCKKTHGVLQRHPAGKPVPPIVHNVLSSSGQPLEAGARAFMERRFGHDFSQVRVHTDGLAVQSAADINAHAYATGHHIVFAPGAYAPSSKNGQETLAHELAHVVQQQKSGLPPGITTQGEDLRISQPGDPAELEAERAAAEVLQDRGAAHPIAISSSPASPQMISRQPKPEPATAQPTKAEEKADAHLNFLATFPDHAITEWRKLTPAAQTLVVFKMMGKYGEPFATDFLAYAQRKKKPNLVTTFTNRASDNPKSLAQRGYRFAGTRAGARIWVHPSGSEVDVISSTASGTKPPPPPPPPEPPDDIHKRCVEHCLLDTGDTDECKQCCEATIPASDQRCRNACDISCDTKL